jgi:hypothetical protein
MALEPYQQKHGKYSSDLRKISGSLRIAQGGNLQVSEEQGRNHPH